MLADTLDLIVNMIVKLFLSTIWLMRALVSLKIFLVLLANDKRFTAAVKDTKWEISRISTSDTSYAGLFISFIYSKAGDRQ